MDKKWNYFDEVQDPKIIGVDPEVMAMLDMARGRAGIPFTITDGKSTPEQDAAIKGRVAHSAHDEGLAVDISCLDDHQLYCMIFGLIMAGFRRIGIYGRPSATEANKFVPTHIHVDNDTTKPLEVIWLSLEQN